MSERNQFLIICTILILIFSFISITLHLSRKYDYDRGFNDGASQGVKYVIELAKDLKNSKKCHVAMVPVITDPHDTIVYFLTPNSCVFDTLINNRIKRNDSFN